jgi:hypothetical protein
MGPSTLEVLAHRLKGVYRIVELHDRSIPRLDLPVMHPTECGEGVFCDVSRLGMRRACCRATIAPDDEALTPFLSHCDGCFRNFAKTEFSEVRRDRSWIRVFFWGAAVRLMGIHPGFIGPTVP